MLRSRSARLVLWRASLSLLWLMACSIPGASLLAKPRKGSPSPAKDNAGLKNIPLTVGHEAKGLVLPNYDLQGHLLGRFEAGTASRIDDNHVRFINLKMSTFDEHDKPDFNVDMTDAILNLETRVISSKERTKIRRADFEIAGDSMQFSTFTHQGTLTGNVHMTIFNQDRLNGKSK